MLDINKIRDDKQKVERSLLKRVSKADLNLDEILKLDAKRKKLIQDSEGLKAERNKHSKVKPTLEIVRQMKEISRQIKVIDKKLAEVKAELKEKMLALPNLPADDVLEGGKENNQVLEIIGEQPKFKFKFKDHVELAERLDLIDYQRATKISGSGFWVYKGDGALLEWALLNYFISYHRQQGYKFLLPPYLLNEASAYASGHLPKFRDDLYWTQDKLCLNATSEMMLVNYHRDEVLATEELPKKYFAYSACFRREAGSYRKEERGMIRGHQFNKIEMFQFVRPDQSWQAFDELLAHAKELLQGLGLHFQISQLAAGDCASAMAKTIDLEVWIPSMGIYKEVSSVSNALDYQSRRANIRFKNKQSGKNEFVHTLNGSGLATSRLIPAILEQNQQADGTVKVPEVLQAFMGKKIIKISN